MPERTITITLKGQTRTLPLLPHWGNGVKTPAVFVDGFGERCDLSFYPYGTEPDEPPIAASDGTLYGLPPVLWPGFAPNHEGNIVGWADEEE